METPDRYHLARETETPRREDGYQSHPTQRNRPRRSAASWAPFAVIGLICTTVGVTIGAMFRGPSPQPERGPAVAVSSPANTENSKPTAAPARSATSPVPVVTVRPVEAPQETAATPAVTSPAPIRSRTAGVRSTYRTPQSTVLARESARRERERPRRRLARRDDETRDVVRETERPRRRRSFRADDDAENELATRPARRRKSLRRDDDRREEVAQETEAPRRRRYSRRSRRSEETAAAVETSPRRRREQSRRGRTEVEVEDIEAAYGARSSRRRTTRDDDSPERLNQKAYRLQRQGRHAEAEPLLRQALKRNPRSPYARYNMGWSLLSQGKPRQALGHLRRTARQQPGRWEPQQRLAEAYERVGDREKAAEARARARALRSGRRRRSTDRTSLPTRAFPTVAAAPAVQSSLAPVAWQQSTDRREEAWLRIKREGVASAAVLARGETR